MSSGSAWPPALKAWVQECLSRATSSANKAAVNAELKQILFDAHRLGTLQTTDWSTMKLKALQPKEPMAVQPIHHQSYPSLSAPTNSPIKATTKKEKKNKKRKGEITDGFPSAYKFESEEEKAAKQRRLERFNNPTPPSNGNGAGLHATGTALWFPDSNGNGALSSRLATRQVGHSKFSNFGYEAEVDEVDPNVMDWDHHTIRGTSTRLEKSYLRLTSEPNPADVRPLPVLKQTLALLKKKWKENRNYAYALDQFKSVRQDLTVQRVKNEFTVEVYEIHARIALEAKDLGEYNQCQSMLRQLYELGLGGHPLEFLSYRIMYLLHTRNRSDLGVLLGQLSPEQKADPGVAHALATARALATSNYSNFFELFLHAPNMSGYILDHFVERERAQALAVMSKAYFTLPLGYLTHTLAFQSDEETDEFLAGHKAAIYVTPPRDPADPWKPLALVPLSVRVWDAKKAHAACAQGVEKYRVVDIKGQVD
ncbi:uncharacterized protein CcaverHIS019_0401810 [Cutaneotrichosporon cavernicola]|uniref:PCI domain-containing protein n=1 Tax=Cutaneotrichosporon cavernicola TaxID=279322 RepID=A0AA48L3N2_9TREE|nr:uncharacterized protein CcaverHIS019_0401810 [Cutaneotrichosporon cavernicola]BEI91361.1 hypothetical protein CcaverHIS019_0401810 [Cutaneotrichosporon cavernicola]